MNSNCAPKAHRLSARYGASALVFCIVASGCLQREVSTQEPTTKISYDTTVPQPAIDKVDVLVMVDSSSSMADKQNILADAVPDLLKGLVQPKCVDLASRKPTGAFADPLKPEGQMCPAGSEPAFAPITDMHIGIVSSSLGSMGSGACPTTGEGSKPRYDDHGHLIAYGPDGAPLPEGGDYHFLAWYPDVVSNTKKDRHPDPLVPKIGSLDKLEKSFRAMVTGVGQNGCGFEAQLESVHRFLTQPDPWTDIVRDGEGRARYAPGVDVELLRQRAAFLRPDSLVAVILLTDEDDSSPDPLSFNGTGWRFMARPSQDKGAACSGCMPRATAACAKSPADPACTSCAFAPNDPSCVEKGGIYDLTDDDWNVRFYRMKQRFGVDPQYPIQRYVDGLTKPRVAMRDQEHTPDGAYEPKNECTNPLFAKHLPTEPGANLCKLERGPRTESLVYFAVIGGVPNELLPNPNDPKATIDWTKILGADPKKWDETGIDAHMVQSTGARPGLPGPGAADDADPVHGREWTTHAQDLQYACTFPLVKKNPDGSITPERRACDDKSSCDCNGTKDSPLCAPDDRNLQVRGKAYPTRRELMLAKELGDHAVVSSLCPKQLTKPDADDYGYRPAVRAITERLGRSLFGSCLPRALEQDADDSVACVVTAILPDAGPDSECQRLYGLSNPSDTIRRHLRDKLVAEEGPASGKLPICEVPQMPVKKGDTCKNEQQKTAFCYVESPEGATCNYGLLFTKPAANIVGARFSMQCIQKSGE